MTGMMTQKDQFNGFEECGGGKTKQMEMNECGSRDCHHLAHILTCKKFYGMRSSITLQWKFCTFEVSNFPTLV